MHPIAFVRRTPSAVLLLVQLLAVLIYPFFEDSVAARAVTAVLGIAVLGAALLVVRATPTLTWVAGVIALPSMVLLVLQVATGDDALFAWSSGFEAALYFYAAFSLLRYMLADERVTTDELFGVAAVFTVIAWAFAHVYIVVQALAPGSFAGEPGSGDVRTWSELLFVSFTNLSNTGYSDIVPVAAHARSVVMIEQLTGVLYLAMVVGRMVSLTTTKRAGR